VEMENKTRSDDPLTNNGVSDIIRLYVIHKEDETIFIIENTNEYGFVDFLVYNKYIKMNRAEMEIAVAE
jgi:hypothetical protein